MADDYDISPENMYGDGVGDYETVGAHVDLGDLTADIVGALLDFTLEDEVGLDIFEASDKGVGDIAKAVVKGGVTKTVAGHVAFLLPPVGIPLAASLAVADKAIQAIEGTRGTPKEQQAVRAAVAQTQAIAKKALSKLPASGTSVASMIARGNAVAKLPQAEREAVHTVHMLASAKRLKEAARKAKGGKPQFGRFIGPTGEVKRGHYQTT
jgi:hypothetical protein